MWGAIKQHILKRLEVLIFKNTEEGINTPNTIRIKFTGDGIQIDRELKVINFAFTILDEGERALLVAGNYSVAIMKTGESYDDLAKGIEDICTEAKDLEVLTTGEKVYRIQFFLVGDLKFLAIVCGIEAANADHACIRCKCPKNLRSDMTQFYHVNK